MSTLKYLAAGLSIYFSAYALGYEQQLYKAVDDQKWRKAERVLNRAERTCEREDKDQNCTLKVTFSRGWTASQRSLSAGEDRQRRHLMQAKAHYQTVLAVRPDHQATVKNLASVLARLGEVDALAMLADKADAGQRAELFILAGDTAFEYEDWPSGFDLFRQSFETNPSKAATRGLVTGFLAGPNETKAKVLAEFSQNPTLPVHIKRSMQEAVIRVPKAVDAALWEYMLLHWVNERALERALTASVIKQTFDIEGIPVLQELVDRLSSPTLGHSRSLELRNYLMHASPGDPWWADSLRRRQALALAGWSTGHQNLLSGDPSFSNDIWIAALFYAPGPDDYHGSFVEERAVYLDILADLARLYRQYETTLDPNRRNFSQVERLLFESKSGAYGVDDLVSIHRHHTILGKLYADLGIFDRGTRGARFQLSRAIETGAWLAEQRGDSDPQPVLHQLLGDGYNCVYSNRQSCRKQASEAAEAYTKAAEAFLKLDDLQGANNAMTKVRGIDVALPPNAAELENQIKLERNISLPLDGG
ncbi:MAG: hypothetical protein AAF541_06765 [Pseudomonadota bacterium]